MISTIPRPGLTRVFSRTARLMTQLLLAGCSTGGDVAPSAPNTLTIYSEVDEGVLSLAYDMPAKFLVFLPLVAADSTGGLEGRLARSWDHSPDYREWTVRLRTDVVWHDGVPVTARDVVFTLDLLKHPAVAYSDPDGYEVRVLDDSTYTIRHRARRYNAMAAPAGTPLDTWTVYYPAHILESLDPAEWMEWEFWTAPVGNGAFRYVRHVPGTALELEANPDFFEGRPRIDRLVLRFGGQPLAELLAGNVDVVPHATEADLLALADNARFRVYHTFEEVNVRAMVWNRRHPVLSDSRVRRALTLAIDREELSNVLNLPPETPIFDAPYTSDQFWRRELPAPLPHDPDRAVRLLAEAGWQTGPDGTLRRGGEPLRLSLLVGQLFGLERAAIYIQSQLREIGVRVDVEPLQLGTVVARVRAEEFDAALIVMPLSGQWAGLSFFEDEAYPQIRESLALARETMDPAAQARIFRDLWPAFQAEIPATFLSPLVRTTIAHARVRGLSMPWKVDPMAAASELWLERD